MSESASASGQRAARSHLELRARERLLLEARAPGGDDLVHVEVAELLPEWAAAPEHPLAHALHGRPQGKAVPVGDKVDCPAHERHPHRLAAFDEALELLRPEALDARPERDVGIARLLRLEADQVLDDLGGRPFRPPEQSLAFQQGPVELASSQSPRCRAITIRCTSFVPSPISNTFWSR